MLDLLASGESRSAPDGFRASDLERPSRRRRGDGRKTLRCTGSCAAGSKEYAERSRSVLSLPRPLPEGSSDSSRGGGESSRAEEDALVQRAISGDRAAWRALYEEHHEFAFRVAARYLGDEAEARDVAQDVFVQIFTRVAAYRPAGRFRTYLHRVVANRCLNERARARYQRRSGGSKGDEDALAAVPDGAGSAEEQLAREQEAREVRAAIACLPERQRLAVILSRYEALSYEEIAAALETSVSAVESLLFRARQTLARELERP